MKCHKYPVLRFQLFTVCVGELADKMPFISPLGPCFGNLSPYCS